MSVKVQVNPVGGGVTQSIELSESNFAAAYNEPLIHQVVVAYQAGARSGTRAQKNRSAVRGGGAKPWRQKGTGRARAGTIRSPLFTGGGRAFPASTRDFSQKVNKKMYRAAMRSILSELHRQERLIVVDEIAMDAPKTRELASTLDRLSANRLLLVLAQGNDNVEKSARNLPLVDVCSSREINPFDLIRFDKVIMTEQAVKDIDASLGAQAATKTQMAK